MTTALIVTVILVFWFIANAAYQSKGSPEHRRKRSAWAWALVGALVGSFFGIAGGPLGAIAGTVPGACVGYLLASNMMKRDFDDDRK
jgi:uncharacterized protein YqgC (DUF456 family)